MKSEGNSAAKSDSVSAEFSISSFHIIRHSLALVFTAGFCLSLVMSEISHYNLTHQAAHLSKMAIPYLLLLSFVTIIFVSTVLTARKIKVDPNSMTICNLFWQEKLPWSQIKSFNSSPHLKYAWLKTKFCPYLLVKTEFKNYAQLEQLLTEYMGGQRY